jgi:hypothetical protein
VSERRSRVAGLAPAKPSQPDHRVSDSCSKQDLFRSVSAALTRACKTNSGSPEPASGVAVLPGSSPRETKYQITWAE